MSDKPSVDDLRARLKDLGYLDAGVDRFVLGPVRPERGLVSVAVRASARIGMLAGLLVGPSASAALAVRLPGLVTGLRDGLVLAVYLGVIFGVAVTLAAFLVIWLLGVLARRIGGAWRGRAQWLARGAGLLVAAACLVYLVLWWRTVIPAGSSWAGGTWTFLALGAAAALSLLIGHVVTLTTLALVAHGSGVPGPELRMGARSWPLTVGLGLLAFGAGAGLLFLVSRGDPVPAREAAAPVRGNATATGVRLTVIGIDGFDRQFVERLRQAGRLPRLARLLDGARATFPPSDAPDPARTWTSIATGQRPDVHGVSGIETRRVAGTEGTVSADEGTLARVVAAATDLVRLTRPALTTGLQRRSKTFWEVAADYGLGTVVVNWWATWPAPEASGVVLTDRATLRLERGGALDAEIAPSDLYPTLLRQWPALRDQARRRVVAAFPSEHDPVEQVLRQAAEQDALPVALLNQFGAPSADLSSVYLPGLDIAHYALLGPSAGGLPASAVAARVEAIERYYLFLEELIAPLIEQAGEQGLVALVADPGRSGASEQGLLALAGPQVRPGGGVEVARHDIMPTLLYALGVPASRELPGRPRVDLLAAAFTARARLREVDSYGRRVIAPRPANVTPLDREMMERLKSLGYVR